ncbi:MAG: sulfatase [Cyclobacteriaceae bacterium]|nr:sulfatase [Cyclobacteriaceae bacterium]
MRYLTLMLCLTWLVTFQPVTGQPSKQNRPNILWLIAEDMGPELACYGNPLVQTPNMDQLAREGRRYTHVYTTAPVCSPSRSAFMTGMYQTSIGAHNHRSHRSDGYQLPEGVRVLTDHFRARGYFTGNIVELTDNADEKFYQGTGKTDWNFAYNGAPFDTKHWSDLKNNQPFYAQINFSETHRGHDWNEAHLHVDRPVNPDDVILPPYYPNHPEARADWAQYLNAIQALDKKIGFVLKKLETDGIDENTIVIFFGDNGRAMVRGKQWPYESGLHIPMIIRLPTSLEKPIGFERGTVDDRLIASIDISATSLALAGIDPPLLMQGRVFLGEDATPPRTFIFGGRDRGDETVDRIRTVRDKQYRYIRNYYPERPFLQTNRYKEFSYPMIALMRELNAEGKLTPEQAYLLAPTRPEEELYDLENDPYEINNLAANPTYSHQLAVLRAALDTWLAETNDQGSIAEPDSIPQYWNDRAKERYDNEIKEMLEKRKQN